MVKFHHIATPFQIKMSMKTLHLPLKAKWYKMIESWEKTEEYREIKPYWIRRFCNTLKDSPFNYCVMERVCSECFHDPYDGEFEQLKFDAVRFSFGYTKRTMTFEIESISIGKGKPEWGAPEQNVFIIKLGSKL